jgi:diguanylate cyclase (GGDEF)-like protein
MVLVGFLLVSVLLGTVLTVILIYRPLHRGMQCVKNDDFIPVKGSQEVRSVASAYNAMLEESRKRKEELRFDATHDVLTGLYNRKAYEDIYNSLDKTTIALLLIDADGFKDVNDTYGHETGDRLLTRIASTLKSCFRADDFVCRIGGDEFAIIMTNTSSQLRDLVAGKIAQVNDLLRAPADDLPSVTISAGVAFGDLIESPDSMFHDADLALYETKRKGRDGCSFAS